MSKLHPDPGETVNKVLLYHIFERYRKMPAKLMTVPADSALC